uniref:Uncharacterized protein n=1 Tax=Oryza sativa subsp. japonica TaxID=39947 RepID=Q5Z6T0_ORYSJ|nr:hypothetical protein [Oryza sativa Japonica Group]BAD54339.1 hypothetical protein [Oryza sativa Japonica Group]
MLGRPSGLRAIFVLGWPRHGPVAVPCRAAQRASTYGPGTAQLRAVPAQPKSMPCWAVLSSCWAIVPWADPTKHGPSPSYARVLATVTASALRRRIIPVVAAADCLLAAALYELLFLIGCMIQGPGLPTACLLLYFFSF